MIKRIFSAVLAMGFISIASAQTGRENIDKLCGCFEVTFKYVETFSPDKDYKFHEREKIIGVTELALPIVKTDKQVVIQHLLVMSQGVMKHWREDWTYENPVQWTYKGDKIWEKKTLKPEEVKGKWTQSVWEVTETPRYQGSSEWHQVNNHTLWENTVDAPLPRREYTQRSDYNILERTNRIVFTDTGYDHIQDNKKISRMNGTNKVIAEERGLNSYVKLPDSECIEGKNYWEEHKGFWLALQQEWNKILNARSSINMVKQTNEDEMMMKLFAMSEEWKQKKLTPTNVNAKVREVLEKHIQ